MPDLARAGERQSVVLSAYPGRRSFPTQSRAANRPLKVRFLVAQLAYDPDAPHHGASHLVELVV